MAKRGKATQEEINFIRAYSTGENALTDEEMAKQLGGSVPWVRKIRREHKISKSGASRKRTTKEKTVAHRIEDGDKTVVNDLSKVGIDEDRSIRKIFGDLFKNSSQYNLLKEMYTAKEIEYYLEEFSSLVAEIRSQGGTLSTSEFRNLDQWIQLTIRRNRLAVQEKNAHEAIRVALSPFDGNINEADEETRAIVFTLQASIKDIPRNIKDITDQAIKIQSELEMTRKERLKRMSDSERGVLNIIKTMQDEEKRAKVDRQAAMLEEAQKKIKSEWEKEGLIISAASKEEANE